MDSAVKLAEYIKKAKSIPIAKNSSSKPYGSQMIKLKNMGIF